MTISVGEMVNNEIVGNPNVKAIYVTLDEENAIESAPSEWNAWTSYKIDGLNEVVEGTETEITIDAPTAINDIIGFRVYAVNYDGTLVDPDGRAFYVEIGKASANEWKAIETIVTPEYNGQWAYEAESNTVALSVEALEVPTDIWGNMTLDVDWRTDNINLTNTEDNRNGRVFEAKFLNAAGKTIYTTADPYNFSNLTDLKKNFSEVAAIRTVPTYPSWSSYKDNKPYTGVLTFTDSKTGRVLATCTVTMTKTLPTTGPKGYSIKTNQLKDGIWNGYLLPSNDAVVENPNFTEAWTAGAADRGALLMENLFNVGEGRDKGNYTFIFDASLIDGSKDIELEVNGDQTLVVNKKFIDNKTAHATTVVYNYGWISSENDNNPYTVEVDSFKSIFNDIYNSTYSWAFASTVTKNIVYGTGDGQVTTTLHTIPYAGVLGKSTFDSVYGNGTTITMAKPYETSITVIEAHLYTQNANGSLGEKDEYFTVTCDGTNFVFKPQSGTMNPTGDVKSTLVVTYIDMYGHEHTTTASELNTVVVKRR